MRRFLSMAAISGRDIPDVKKVLDWYQPEEKKETEGIEFYSCVPGTLVLFPEYGENVSKFLSEAMTASVLFTHIYDEKFWVYLLFVNGQLEDCFNPVPDFYSPVPKQQFSIWRGDAARVCRSFPGLQTERIANYLRFWDDLKEGETFAYPEDKHAYRDGRQATDFIRRIGFAAPELEEKQADFKEEGFSKKQTECVKSDGTVGSNLEWIWFPEKNFSEIREALEKLDLYSPAVLRYFELESKSAGSFILFSQKTPAFFLLEPLCAALDAKALYIRIHQHNFWGYTLFENGKIADKFAPEFSSWSEKCAGSPEKLQILPGYTQKAADYCKTVYQAPDKNWESAGKFMHMFGLPWLGEEAGARETVLCDYPAALASGSDLEIANFKLFLIINENLGLRVAKKYDMTKLKTLDLQTLPLKALNPVRQYYTVGDFACLQYASNLKSLNMTGFYVNDFSFLKSCKKLQKLGLSHSGFEDVSLLTGLSALKSLDLSYNPMLLNLSKLEDLPALRQLTIDRAALHGYDAEKRLPHVEILYRDDCILPALSLEVVDCIKEPDNDDGITADKEDEPDEKRVSAVITDFAKLTCASTLQKLETKPGSRPVNITVLEGFQKLKALSLKKIGLSDISFLSNLQNLRELVLTDNEIQDFTPLTQLPRLESLNIVGNPGTDLTFVSQLPSLTELFADSKQIPNEAAMNNLSERIWVRVVRATRWGVRNQTMERIPPYPFEIPETPCKESMGIYEDTILQEIFDRDHGVQRFFQQADPDMTCFQCSSAAKETLEQACQLHKVDTQKLLNNLRWHFYLKQQQLQGQEP